jgi:hypothetical protein
MIAIILDRPADSTKISRLFDVGRVVFHNPWGPVGIGGISW